MKISEIRYCMNDSRIISKYYLSGNYFWVSYLSTMDGMFDEIKNVAKIKNVANTNTDELENMIVKLDDTYNKK